MSSLTILLIAVGLAMDTFAVAIAVSVLLDSLTGRHVFRLAFHCGLFQALMPILGWFAGLQVGWLIAGWDHWVAFGLLGCIGGKAIYEALSRGGNRSAARLARSDPTRGLSLVGLSVATSLDALAVGLSLAMLRVTIWYPSLIIGLVAFALTGAGMLLGRQLGKRFGQQVEICGGLVLILIGLKIVLEHS